jgi:DNA (cytosine-5)-methyltransferase 1
MKLRPAQMPLFPDDERPARRAANDNRVDVDLFAGGGGAGEGKRRATDKPPDVAINHWPVAISMYSANHPTTRVLIEDIRDVEPLEATLGALVRYLWGSPTCVHFSRASGKRLSPEAVKIRALATCCSRGSRDAARGRDRRERDRVPRLGPGLRHARRRLPWPRRRERHDMHGRVQVRPGHPGAEGHAVRRVAPRDRGARLLVRVPDPEGVGVRRADDARARLHRDVRRRAAATSGPSRRMPGQRTSTRPGKKPWRTAAEIIDWSIPCPSIFDRKTPHVPRRAAGSRRACASSCSRRHRRSCCT